MDKKSKSPEYLYTTYVQERHWLFMDLPRMLDIATECLNITINSHMHNAYKDDSLYLRWAKFIRQLKDIKPEALAEQRSAYFEKNKISKDRYGK